MAQSADLSSAVRCRNTFVVQDTRDRGSSDSCQFIEKAAPLAVATDQSRIPRCEEHSPYRPENSRVLRTGDLLSRALFALPHGDLNVDRQFPAFVHHDR